MKNTITTLLIFFGLILIHETGHLLAGYILGIPRNRMAIQFVNREKKKNLLHAIAFSITPHLALLDENDQKIAPSPNPVQMEKYVKILEHYIPSEQKMYWFVAGGHVFELLIILCIVLLSWISQVTVLEQIAFQMTRMALILALVYLLMELFSYMRTKELTGGDFTGQWALSPVKTVVFYSIYFTGLIYAWLLMRM